VPRKPAEVRPEWQPYLDAIAAFMHERNWTRSELVAQVYGGDAPPGAASGLYSVMRGAAAPGLKLKQLLLDRVGLDLTHIHHDRARRQEVALTPAHAAVLAYQQANSGNAVESVRKAPQQPPRFSMTIQQDGRSEVHVNFNDLDVEEAMRCMAAVVSTGLLPRR
jgi:hypothetical protein